VGSIPGPGTALSLLDGLVNELQEERRARGMSPLSTTLQRMTGGPSSSVPGPRLPDSARELMENAILPRMQAHHVMSIERMIKEGAEIVPGSDGEELGPGDSISQGRREDPEEGEITVRRVNSSSYRRISGEGGDLAWIELTPAERREISDRELRNGRTEYFEADNFFD